jgi:hypothetical protein
VSWVRLEGTFAGNPKIAELTDAEFRVWVRLLCYCGEAKDPTVDRRTQREVSGLFARRVTRFYSLGLLDAVGEGFEVHDWLKYQPKDMTNADRQARFRARRSVTPTVTKPVTDIGTPSRAGAFVPSRTEELRQEDLGLPAVRSETTLPVKNELGIARLLAFVGDSRDEATEGVIRGFSRRLPEGSLAKVLESAQSKNGQLENRAAYVVAALKSEVAEVGT